MRFGHLYGIIAFLHQNYSIEVSTLRVYNSYLSLLGRNKEARDAARASLGQPAWTVGKDPKVSNDSGDILCLLLSRSHC
jgi:hypothetical protein